MTCKLCCITESRIMTVEITTRREPCHIIRIRQYMPKAVGGRVVTKFSLGALVVVNPSLVSLEYDVRWSGVGEDLLRDKSMLLSCFVFFCRVC